MRRWRALLLALCLAPVILVVVAPAQACACGGVVDQPGGDTSVSAETAVVVWDGTQETILLRLSTRSEAVTAGLLVPTPTPALSAMSRTGASTPDAANTAAAASSKLPTLRCASARWRRPPWGSRASASSLSTATSAMLPIHPLYKRNDVPYKTECHSASSR